LATVFVVVDVPVVVVVGGRLRGPAPVPVAVAKIAGPSFRSPFPGRKRVPGRGRYGECRVTPQMRQEQGSPPHDLQKPLRSFAGNGRYRHAPAVEMPPRREVGIGPWHGPVVGVEASSHSYAHVHPIVRGSRRAAWCGSAVGFGQQPVA
jgi:hypothetical protein